MTPGINRYAFHGFLLAGVNASTCYPAALLHLRNPSLRTEASVSWIVVNIHWIMILSGVLTMTMVYAALAPDAALRSTFGESVSGPVADTSSATRERLLRWSAQCSSSRRENRRCAPWP
jgi:hypothetical protein